MNKVLKLQRVGLITPTVVEYEGKVLATNHLDIESLCNLWRVHFGFYTTEKVDLAMTKKQFSSIQQKTLSSVKSVYELFYERNFIPREFEANEEHTEWGMYRNKELEKLEAENAALRERLENVVGLPCKIGDIVYKVHDRCNGKACPYNGDYGQWRCHYEGKQRCEPFVETIQFCYENIPQIGKTIFISKEEAESRLADLKGEKKND